MTLLMAMCSSRSVVDGRIDGDKFSTRSMNLILEWNIVGDPIASRRIQILSHSAVLYLEVEKRIQHGVGWPMNIHDIWVLCRKARLPLLRVRVRISSLRKRGESIDELA